VPLLGQVGVGVQTGAVACSRSLAVFLNVENIVVCASVVKAREVAAFIGFNAQQKGKIVV
jgi:hypothetical protein